MEEDEALRLVHTYADLILHISFAWLKHTQDAVDICQTVFLKYLSNGPVFDTPEHEKAWIIRTTVNACKDCLKSAFRKRTVSMEAVTEQALPEVFDTGMEELLRRLPRGQRLSIYLYYYEGYSTREIAGLLGKSENVISSYLSRGRKRLREYLTPEYSSIGKNYRGKV